MATQHLVSMSASGRRLVVHADGSLWRPLGLNLSLGPEPGLGGGHHYIAIAAGFVGELSVLDEKERSADATFKKKPLREVVWVILA